MICQTRLPRAQKTAKQSRGGKKARQRQRKQVATQCILQSDDSMHIKAKIAAFTSNIDNTSNYATIYPCGCCRSGACHWCVLHMECDRLLL